MDAAAFLRREDRIRDNFADAGMRGMAFDHHWAADRQGCYSIASCHRKGQREVRRTKDRDRADPPLDHPKLRPRQRLTIGQSLVASAVQIIPREDMRGKELQLHTCAGSFTLEPNGLADRFPNCQYL